VWLRIENHLAGLPTAALTGDGVKVSLPNRFNRKEAIMNYSGIDLHSNNSVVSVIDETDRVVAEQVGAVGSTAAFQLSGQESFPVSPKARRKSKPF
jgi:hypothetical protein